MNPSNFGDLKSNSDAQNLTFNSPSIPQSSGKPLQKTRSVKVRRQPNALNLKSTADTWAGSGFNPFRPVFSPNEYDEFAFGKGGNKAFVFGASKHGDFGENSGENEVVGKMKIWRTASGNIFFNKNLNASVKSDFVFGSDHGGANKICCDDGNVKLLNTDDNKITSKAVDERNSISGASIAKSVESTLSDDLPENLNVKETENYPMEEPAGRTDMEFSSSRVFEKDMQAGNGNYMKLHDIARTYPAELTFKEGMQDKEESCSQVHVNRSKADTRSSRAAEVSFTFSSSGLAGGNVFGSQPTDRVEKRESFVFTSKQDDSGSPFLEFKTPNLKGNLFCGPNQKVEISAKFKDTKSKKKNVKLRQPAKVHLWPGQDLVSWENEAREISEPSDSSSSLHVSPYQETLSDTRLFRQTSAGSEGSFVLDDQHLSTNSNDAIDEDLTVAKQKMNINKENVSFRDGKKDGSDKGIGDENPPEESISGAQTGSFNESAFEEIDVINDIMFSSTETKTSSSTNIQRQNSDVITQFSSKASSGDMDGSGFTFGSASASQASSNRQIKNKVGSKVGHDPVMYIPNAKIPCASSSQFIPSTGASLLMSPPLDKKMASTTPIHVVGRNAEGLRRQDSKQESDLVSAASVAAQEACEKWRLRGNQAYTHGDLSKAEDYYTQGINCVSRSETSRSCLRALMLCYSNRAATRMSLTRIRDAIHDCKLAAEIDPNFLKVQVRAANCYLIVGEVEDASQHFKRCLQLGSDMCVDRKTAVEASEGIQRAQKVSECLQHSAELLEKKTPNDAGSALELIAEGLMISPYSEKLLETKAASLFLMQKYDEVIQLCDQTFDSAEKNSPFLDVGYRSENLDSAEHTIDESFGLWRCYLILKSYFYLGKLEEAVGSLEKREELIARSLSRTGSKMSEPLNTLSTTVRELLHHKAAGNEAFQAGKHSEAIEHYTAALSCNLESLPFAAICYCNRAAAYKALGHITDAISDCNLAIALDGNYLKAISRRAALYETIRDYGQAVDDLQKLVAVLTKQVEEKTDQSKSSDRSGNLANDLRQARMRLSTIEEASRKEIPLDMYLILGVEPSASASEIKKAYRKAALRHHPDKASQSLARIENGDNWLWKEIGEEVHEHADRLFKIIGEAYAILSDPTKRSQYDQEEEMRNAQKKLNVSSTFRMHTETGRSYQFEKSSSMRRWAEAWRSYGR